MLTSDLVQEVLERKWRKYDMLHEGASESEERTWIRWQCRSVAEHHNMTNSFYWTLSDKKIVCLSRNVRGRLELTIKSINGDKMEVEGEWQMLLKLMYPYRLNRCPHRRGHPFSA